MAEPRRFTLIRHTDETGISGRGRVLDGIIFHTGQVVICWRSDLRVDAVGYSSLAIYASWDAFLYIHVNAHANSSAEIQFLDPVVEV